MGVIDNDFGVVMRGDGFFVSAKDSADMLGSGDDIEGMETFHSGDGLHSDEEVMALERGHMFPSGVRGEGFFFV